MMCEYEQGLKEENHYGLTNEKMCEEFIDKYIKICEQSGEKFGVGYNLIIHDRETVFENIKYEIYRKSI